MDSKRDSGGNMFILELNQEGVGTEIGLFQTMEEGRAFISQVEGYQCKEEEGFVFETLDARKLPEYLELQYNGHLVPLTKFMFTEEGEIDIFWKELPNLSAPGKGMVEGSTRVDAYLISNDEVKDYIARRESQYRKAKAFLEAKGYEAERAYFGSKTGKRCSIEKKGVKTGIFLPTWTPVLMRKRISKAFWSRRKSSET